MHRSGSESKEAVPLGKTFFRLMASVTDYLHPKDLARLANHQVLAKRVVEGFVPDCIAPRTRVSVWSSSNTAHMFPGMRFATSTGKSSAKATASTFGNMRRRQICGVTCSSMQAVPWTTGARDPRTARNWITLRLGRVPLLYDAQADRQRWADYLRHQGPGKFYLHGEDPLRQ